MSNKPQNIHPIFERTLTRRDKEDLLKQNALVIWLTGLSGSGKSTIAIGLERKLFEHGILTQILDGDNIRSGINNNLGFSESDREENIRRIAEVSKLFIQCGIVCINSFVSPMRRMRAMARDIIGPNDFIEVYIDVPFDVAEKRDVKGLYKKAREGKIKDFTGLDSVFEAPEQAHVHIKTDEQSVEDSVDTLYNYVINKILKKKE